jgi:NAD+ synthase
MYSFDAKSAAEAVIKWIKDWFDENGKGCRAVVGISGGKDSSVVAALCVRALGRENVVGVLMPCGEQSDIDYSKDLVKELGIENVTVNIKSAVDALLFEVEKSIKSSEQARINLQPRVRMSVLYAVSQSVGGRVANTCNLSEDWVGYSTRYGDNAGDFSPLSKFTVAEVKAIGRWLGLSEKFIVKPPIDGLSGKTDEDNLGFTYEVLDKYIREGVVPEKSVKERIDSLHERNLFKLRYMDVFPFEPKK